MDLIGSRGEIFSSPSLNATTNTNTISNTVRDSSRRGRSRELFTSRRTRSASPMGLQTDSSGIPVHPPQKQDYEELRRRLDHYQQEIVSLRENIRHNRNNISMLKSNSNDYSGNSSSNSRVDNRNPSPWNSPVRHHPNKSALHYSYPNNSQNYSLQGVSNSVEALDWRLAIGEVAMNIRREVADKASREELYSAIRGEMEILTRKVSVRS